MANADAKNNEADTLKPIFDLRVSGSKAKAPVRRRHMFDLPANPYANNDIPMVEELSEMARTRLDPYVGPRIHVKSVSDSEYIPGMLVVCERWSSARSHIVNLTMS